MKKSRFQAANNALTDIITKASSTMILIVPMMMIVMNLKTLEAYTEENNVKSIKLLESFDFIEVNRVDDEGYFNNRVYHMVVYRLEK